LVFIIKTKDIPCAVRPASLNIIQANFRIFINLVLKYLAILSELRLQIDTAV
jgi:hypothetical protein